MSDAIGAAAVVRGDDVPMSGERSPAHRRSVELTMELANARVAAILAVREFQRVAVAGASLRALADASDAASLAAGRLAGFARMLAATLPKLT